MSKQRHNCDEVCKASGDERVDAPTPPNIFAFLDRSRDPSFWFKRDENFHPSAKQATCEKQFLHNYVVTLHDFCMLLI